MPARKQPEDVPVYLFTGFLEGGKTKFIQETMEDPRFNKGERTLKRAKKNTIFPPIRQRMFIRKSLKTNLN